MKKAIDELAYINSNLKAKGIHFLFVLVPDKQLIYPEFMPDKYRDDAALLSYERMSRALKSTEVDVIDTKPILLDKKRETGKRLYYMRDNRWNQFGNFLITQEIMSHLGRSFPMPQYELISVDTSEKRIVTGEVGNDLNDLLQSLSPWLEKGAPEPVYNVTRPEQAPDILWYGDCFSAPLTEFVKESWPGTITYVSLYDALGFPVSFREDLERRLEGEKIVILELDEHYRQELSRMLVPELPRINPDWSLLYNWQSDSLLKGWAARGAYDIQVTDDKVLVTVEGTNVPASFYNTARLVFPPSKKYYLVIKLTSPAATGVVVDFSATTKDILYFEGRRTQHSYKGDNTIIFEFPEQETPSTTRSIHIYLGNEAGTYGISEVAIYSSTQ